jgi:hypothetical protein
MRVDNVAVRTRSKESPDQRFVGAKERPSTIQKGMISPDVRDANGRRRAWEVGNNTDVAALASFGAGCCDCV